jgi:hypothetical protein
VPPPLSKNPWCLRRVKPANMARHAAAANGMDPAALQSNAASPLAPLRPLWVRFHRRPLAIGGPLQSRALHLRHQQLPAQIRHEGAAAVSATATTQTTTADPHSNSDSGSDSDSDSSPASAILAVLLWTVRRTSLG